VISGFRREDDNSALLGGYAVSSGNFLSTFRDISGLMFRSRESVSSGNSLPTFRDNISGPMFRSRESVISGNFLATFRDMSGFIFRDRDSVSSGNFYRRFGTCGVPRLGIENQSSGNFLPTFRDMSRPMFRGPESVSSGNFLQTFRDNPSGPMYMGRECLPVNIGPERLYRNVGTKLPVLTA
jgi:hypothetical protein